MKIETITVHYGEKRTGNYQSVDHSVSVTVTVDAEEKAADVLKRLQKSLRDQVTEFTIQEIDRVVEESRGGGGRG